MTETKPQNRLFLLDAMALIYRAFYALNKNPRINSKGLNTSAVMGFANTLYDIIKNEKPSHIGVAFDTMAPTVRHEDFFQYKANRQAMPEDLSAAIPVIIKLIEAFNIPVIFSEGYEADDVIGTLAKKAEQEGFETFMVTPDKDFGQLVSEHIHIYKPAKFGEKAVLMGVKEVCEKYSIQHPEQLIDILALWGDASDNIPGIPGVGEVTAKKLIGTFGSFENIYENLDKIDNVKLRQKFEENHQQGIMSKQLATIILDVPVDFNARELVLAEPNQTELKKLLDELELRAFAKRVFTDLSLLNQKPQIQSYQGTLFEDSMGETAPVIIDTGSKLNITTVAHEYRLIESQKDRMWLIEELGKQKFFCFDTETTGLDTAASELVGMSFAWESHKAYFVLLPEEYDEAFAIVQEFKALFENPDTMKIGQNIKFDISILKWYEISVEGKLFDTLLAHYLLEPDLRHNMNYLAESYLNYSPVSIEELIGKKGQHQRGMRSVEKEKLKEYAAEDADITLQLMHHFAPLLEENEFTTLFNTIEMPLVPVLAAMEQEGVKVDTKALNEYSNELEGEILDVQTQIYDMAGRTFNISSPKQLGEILFNELKIVEATKFTKTKQFSTSEDTLQKLAHKHPIIEKILDYRSLTKLKSTYVDVLPRLISPRTGRLHTTYNQAVASTGRLSSNNPNLQNIPIRTERGREVRKAFVPRNADYLLLSADYSQIELRIIAELSHDEAMQDAFRQGLDIHTATAAKVFGVPLDEVTKDMRRKAKMVNFGIIYGISAFGLSERLNIPKKEAAEIIDNYFLQYPGIKIYMDQQIAFAHEHGYVETMMKRKRYLRDINSNNANIRNFAERNAINAPIQGSAADMIKIAMILIYNEFNRLKLKSKLILQVHDELIVDVHLDEIEVVKKIVESNMQQAIPLSIPVETEMNTGKNWLEAH
ncbi:MAG: DNA polymerase I [Bacteroidota bacterium]